ncbi:hypothetical protein [Burkholderia mayonis]|uniref:GP32 family protein n=1 Tax=Burkholderia mayonis TaxID=1385591 RepID=A0A1B4FS44_9BURK|nr:hypothetical protein WS71_03575 [Burkholderia mayonis]KVE51271.1 hypothetical protein WS71_13265 [Burkholderia mayonis]
MILPPFDPPKLPEMTEWWKQCTYADVHRLILEVQHQRLTLWELRGCVADASRRARAIDPVLLEYGAPLRRLGTVIDKEIERAQPIVRSRQSVAPFSDEWRARQAIRCSLHAAPDDPVPCADAKQFPEFRRVTWRELRERWRWLDRKKTRTLTVEQRMVLEIAFVRRKILDQVWKMVAAVEAEAAADGKALFTVDRLKRFLDVEREDGDSF